MTASLRARRLLGWTQDQLAQVLGVHSLTVSKWERHRLTPSPYQDALLHAFCAAACADPGVGARAAATLAQAGAIRALHEILQAAYQRD